MFDPEREEIAAKLLAHRVNRGCTICTFDDWWIGYVFDKGLKATGTRLWDLYEGSE